MKPFPSLVLATALLAPAAVAEESKLPEPHPDLPDDFQQLLPRGEIPAVDDPTFVSAAEAEIADDAWVLGVTVDGTAHAYSLNLLNRHEVVNDTIAGQPIAAVW